MHPVHQDGWPSVSTFGHPLTRLQLTAQLDEGAMTAREVARASASEEASRCRLLRSYWRSDRGRGRALIPSRALALDEVGIVRDHDGSAPWVRRFMTKIDPGNVDPLVQRVLRITDA